MADYDEETNLCKYGTPLDPLDEDDLPRKKGANIEDQVAVDVNGRRRFHGAFTGGFSAGFCNTVGSLEGWTPSTFKSSRQEKFQAKQQKPEDYMDTEDREEWGIAPQRIKAKEEYGGAQADKRKRQTNSTAPIPDQATHISKMDPDFVHVSTKNVSLLTKVKSLPTGCESPLERSAQKRSSGDSHPVGNEFNLVSKDTFFIQTCTKSGSIFDICVARSVLYKVNDNREPVLQMLLAPPVDSVGARLLKAMGWRDGQGVGPRRERGPKVYGCERPPTADNETKNDEPSVVPDGMTFAPLDTQAFIAQPKLDTFGMGYSGLNRRPVLQQFSMYEYAGLNMQEKNKKVSISGQAFGVGAFEEEDADIYTREDMTQYDFSLGQKEKEKPTKKSDDKKSKYVLDCLEGFHLATVPEHVTKNYPLPKLPVDFKPTCGQRKSRFEPVIKPKIASSEKSDGDYRRKGLGRHDLNPEVRRDIMLGDSTRRELDKQTEVADYMNDDIKKNMEEARKITSALGDSVGSFKPFATNVDKERRYNIFVNMSREERLAKFEMIQSLSMTAWERERERREFEQAERLYKPLQGLMSDRFVSGNADIKTEPSTSAVESGEIQAARAKMFGKLTRKTETWRPVSLLCKRFNVTEPAGGCARPDEELDKKTNFSVFDYLETPVHNKMSFNKASANYKTDSKQTPNYENNSSISKASEVGLRKLVLPDPKTSDEVIIDDGDTTKMDKEQERIEEEQSSSLKLVDDANAALIEKSKSITNPAESKNLFQSIFCSSSESESEEEKEDIEALKRYVLGETIVDDPLNKDTVNESSATIPEVVKSASDFNLVRNTAAPTGIFAGIDLDAINSSRNSEKIVFIKPILKTLDATTTLDVVNDQELGHKSAVLVASSVIETKSDKNEKLDKKKKKSKDKDKKKKKKKDKDVEKYKDNKKSSKHKKHKSKKSKHKKSKHQTD